MKLYRIVMCDGAWAVLGGEPERILAQSDDKEVLLAAARKLVAIRKGELFVSDESGRPDVIYTYTQGAESVYFPGTA